VIEITERAPLERLDESFLEEIVGFQIQRRGDSSKPPKSGIQIVDDPPLLWFGPLNCSGHDPSPDPFSSETHRDQKT
jgi:hypothetical protein